MTARLTSDQRRHTRISDSSSTALKEAERKLKHLRRASEWMERNGLAPLALPATPEAVAALTARVEMEDHGSEQKQSN
jgi:hypothetical protein